MKPLTYSTRLVLTLLLTSMLILFTCGKDDGPVYSARANVVDRPEFKIWYTRDTLPAITDTTILKVTLRQLNQYADKLKDQMSARAYESFLAGMQVIVTDIIGENRKGGKK